ncbi:M10 family metallopeptidase C-terminal domain-containing protein [Rhizobium sp.]
MGFAGKKLDYAYYFPIRATPVDGNDFDVGQITVGNQVEVSGAFYTMDVSDTQIRFEFKDVGLFANATFNGIVLTDVDGEVNRMWGFWLQTNMPGLTKKDIVVDDDTLAINFAGAAFTTRSYIHIQMLFSENPVTGSKQADVLVGTSGADKIKGLGGDDILRGEAAPDIARSSAASAKSVTGDMDRFVGGGGTDTFVFATGDTAARRDKADMIMDFAAGRGEVIDLTEWDADRRAAGHQDFDYIGRKAFTGDAGELRYTIADDITYVEGDTNGDRRADFTIRLVDAGKLTADNFEL